MRMRKSEMRMRQSDKKTLAFEYEFSLKVQTEKKLEGGAYSQSYICGWSL